MTVSPTLLRRNCYWLLSIAIIHSVFFTSQQTCLISLELPLRSGPPHHPSRIQIHPKLSLLEVSRRFQD